MTRGVRTGVLVGVAIAVAVACMVGLSAQAVANRAACSGGYTQVGVAVSNDIAPAIQTIASSFNKTRARAGGLCVRVHVSAAESSTTAAEIDGQSATTAPQPATTAPAGSKSKPSKTATAHLPAGIDAWIPDSILWVDEVNSFAQGAMVLTNPNISVAKSPLVIVTTQSVADASGMQAFAGPVSWRILLPPGFGGPPSYLGLTVELPDPTVSAVGLATAIEVTKEINTLRYARTTFTNFVNDSETTENTDSVPALANFVSTTKSLGRRAVTVASEQAVLAYDKARPAAPLVARYPTGMTSSLGTPELDYPYVLTTSAAQQKQAAEAFGTYLESPYAQSVVRYYGFRSANGVPDAMPTSTGLSTQPLQVASALTYSNETSTMSDWTRLGLGSRDMVLLDVSPAMNAPSGLPGVNLEDELAVTAQRGLNLFPASTHMGFWIIGAAGSTPANPADQMISLGGLTQDYGLTTRKQQLLGIVGKLPAAPKGNLLLYDSIWQAYQKMTASYSPDDGNAVVVLTAGIDGKGDMTASQLMDKLKTKYNPNKKVEVVILMFGSNQKIFDTLNTIAVSTGGGAYEVQNPSQIKRIFDEAWAQRLCEQSCTTP